MSVAQEQVAAAGRGGSDTAERILSAALAAFATRGVEATSLDSVASAVGVRKQTILYWFPSKEALLFAVIDRAVAELGTVLTKAVLRAGADTLDAQVTAAIDATFRLGRNRPEVLALVREVARVGPPALAHLGRTLDPLLTDAAGAIAAGKADLGANEARSLLVAAGARVVGLATEAELLTALDRSPDLRWLRHRRAALRADLVSGLR